MLIALFGPPGAAEDWRRAFQDALPDDRVCLGDEIDDDAAVDVVVGGFLPAERLRAFANLKLIVSLLAGVDRLVKADLPDVPIVRAGNPDGDAMMNEMALLHVLRHHREMPQLAAAQAMAVWDKRRPVAARLRRVGVLGLGAIGASAARCLAGHGFQVSGWSRTAKRIPGVTCLHGRDAFETFLGSCTIFVNLLALTPETENILDAAAFAAMPAGAALVNLGRGHHVVDADLLDALDSGHLAAATLDVFREEPLPPAHPFWRHSKITITPHASRALYPEDFAPALAEQVRRLKAGEALLQVVDRARGY